MTALLALTSCDYNPGDPARWEPRSNEAWPDACADHTVAILIDRSRSIGDTSDWVNNWLQVTAVRQALTGNAGYGTYRKGLLDYLAEGNARVWIGSFGTLAKTTYPTNDTYVSLKTPANLTAAKDAVTNLPFGGTQRDWAGNQWTTSYNDYPDDASDGASGRGNTNWQGAIDAAPGVPDLTIVLTDGDPSMYNKFATPNGNVQESTVNAAVNQANSYKFNGGRVVAVHFGAKNAGGPYGGWEQRLQRISGQVSGSDYFSTTYDGLISTLGSIDALKCVPPPPPTTTTTTTTTTRPPAAGIVPT